MKLKKNILMNMPNMPINMPENIPEQMKNNTKEFKEYLNVLEYSQTHRECPQSLLIVALYIIIMIILIKLLLY